MTVTCPNCRNEISVSKFMPVSVRCKKCKSVFNVEYNPDELGFWGKQKLKCNNFSIAHPNITKAAKITIGLAIAAGLTKLALDSRPESTQAGLPAESEDTASDDVSSTESNGKTPPPEEPASSDDIKPEVEPSISKTDFERHLLDRLLSGGLDGPVGSPFGNGYGSTIMYAIQDGIIKRFKQGPTQRVFDGDETEKIIPNWKNDRKLETEEEQLDFLRRQGRYVNDPEVQAYSNAYWDKKHQR